MAGEGTRSGRSGLVPSYSGCRSKTQDSLAPVKLMLVPTSSEWERDPETYVALRTELNELGYTTEIVDRHPDTQKHDPLADLELHFNDETPGHAQADALAKLVRRRLRTSKHFSIYGRDELLRQGWSG